MAGVGGDDKHLLCPQQGHHPLQVHTQRFMAPSPSPGDLSACHSPAFSILSLPHVPPTTHPGSKGPACLLPAKIYEHAPLLINFCRGYSTLGNRALCGWELGP